MLLRAVWLIGAGLAVTGAAQANSGSAVLGIGGLQLVQNDDVAMLSEDLYISADEIRIRYEFSNLTNADIETLVAFPLPPVDLATMWYDTTNINRPDQTTGVLLDFTVTVDGQPIRPELSVRSFFEGEEVTETLAGYGVGLERSFLEEGYREATAALTPAAKAELAEAGLVEVDGSDVYPLWTQEAAFYWSQTFPAGRTIVAEHSYKPIGGGAFFSAMDLDAARATGEYIGIDYCIDAETAGRIGRALEAAPHATLFAELIDYVLSTGASWAGPIGRFHLTVDQGAPGNILALCIDGMAPAGPTTSETTITDFEPTADLRILVLGPIPP